MLDAWRFKQVCDNCFVCVIYYFEISQEETQSSLACLGHGPKQCVELRLVCRFSIGEKPNLRSLRFEGVVRLG